MSRPLHIATEVIHAGYAADHQTGATSPSVVASTSFAAESPENHEAIFAGTAPGFVYSRIANPSVMQLERRMAGLERGIGAVACASGMAAITAVVLSLVGERRHIVCARSIFGGTHSLFGRTLRRHALEVDYVDATDVEAVRGALRDDTALLFLETMGNPKLDVPDCKKIAQVAAERDVVFVVDNTVGTPVLFRPGEVGAHLVVHSLSKYVSGHGHAIGGMIVDTGKYDWTAREDADLAAFTARHGRGGFLGFLRGQVYRDLGCCMSPFTAFLLSISMESLALRMERHCDNALAVAEMLSGAPGVEDVAYPGLSSHPQHGIAAEQFSGRFGGLVTLRLGTKDRAFRFMNGLQRVQFVANLGDAKTLAVHPASTFCRDLTPEDRAAVGVTEDMVRLSIGLEHEDDIMADLERGLAVMEEEGGEQ